MTKIETITKWLKEPESKKILAPKTLTSCVYNEIGSIIWKKVRQVPHINLPNRDMGKMCLYLHTPLTEMVRC